ncbi:uncharacterized protein LOC127835989, partial [Dreissena polymorpha]|uniref:uncharacterized protein LOC127835989 n=1 Tax=Dreissena polymorpha TaxID=45954 RepID=UPI002264F744
IGIHFSTSMHISGSGNRNCDTRIFSHECIYVKKMDSNTTENTTDGNEISSVDNASAVIELVLVPVIAVFGLVGNAFSCAIFSTKPLIKSYSSLLLSMRSVSDSGFLITLLVIWMTATRWSRTCGHPVKQVTTMLFAITLIFLILNLPSHIVRLRVSTRLIPINTSS